MPALIQHNLLLSACTDEIARNEAIAVLETSHETEVILFPKLVLAAWLGSNSAFAKLHPFSTPTFFIVECMKNSFDFYKNNNFCIRHIAEVGYLFFVHLEKMKWQLNKLAVLEASIAENRLVNCQKDLLVFLNENHNALTQNPKEFFINILQKVTAHLTDRYKEKKVDEIADSIRHAFCVYFQSIILFSEFSVPEKILIKKNYFNTINPVKYIYSNLPSNVSNKISTGLNTLITWSHRIHYTHYYFPENTYISLSAYLIKKIILKSKDGVMVDGLFVGKRGQESTSIVLALIGHFQSEHFYLSPHYLKFYHLFNADIVLINHRNYSFLSAAKAKNPQELAEDVVTFAEHFKDRNLVLYGMCGGAAHIMLAADTLRNKNVKFKLIVDRFSQQYDNWLEVRNIYRLHKNDSRIVNPVTKGMRLIVSILFFALLKTIISLLILTSSAIKKFDLKFGKIINIIPYQDLLILQAKSPKRVGFAEPNYTDLMVHPNNDLRNANKERRHYYKNLLNSLATNCKEISDNYHVLNISETFLCLSNCFRDFLKLISSEKLMLHIEPPKVTDLHCHKLYELETRNKIKISTFINGFFTATDEHSQSKLLTLLAHSKGQIVKELVLNHPSKTIQNKSVFLKDHLTKLLDEIAANLSFLTNMASRAKLTMDTDIATPITKLLNYCNMKSEVANRFVLRK